MENLNLILFIGIAAPLGMMVLVCKERAGRVILFLLFGMTICLLCGEIDGRLLPLTGYTEVYFTCNISPVTEELFKALPVIIYAFVDKPERQLLLESAIAVGVGFAVQENAYILASSPETLSIVLGII